MYTEADKLLARLGVTHSSKKLCSELSIGEQQMVEIAKALSFESQVIIMDEPTDALTDTETESLFNVIRELKAENRGIVYISHRLKEIFQICDDVTVLRDGQFIGERVVADIVEDDLIEMMVGRRLDEQYPHLARKKGECVLSVEHLSGSGIDDVSFTLHAGEIVGVSGLMGAGRTELGKLLYGALPKTSGKVRLKNQDIENHTPQDGLDNGIVYISEDRKGDGLILGMSVKENMSLTSLDHFSNRGNIRHQAEKMAVDDFILMFNIKTPSRDQQVGLLSGGNQQKVVVARELEKENKFIIVSQPTRGVDIGAIEMIHNTILHERTKGKAVLVVSAELTEIMTLSDRIAVMYSGKIVGVLDRKDATMEKLGILMAGGKLDE